jgi:hypothetical protein
MFIKRQWLTWLGLLAVFLLLGIWFYGYRPGPAIWLLLDAAALGFLLVEAKLNSWELAKKMAGVGAFLCIFDFAFENAGSVLGYWFSTNSAFFVLHVPLEIIFLTFVGGVAWAMYLPKKFDLKFSIADIALFAMFGAVGEWVLIQNGLMHYYQGWTSLHAFVSYGLTWVLLHAVRYKLVKQQA